jgi:hypothetical protein
VYGGVPKKEQVDALKRGVEVVVGTPGRLEDLMGEGACVLHVSGREGGEGGEESSACACEGMRRRALISVWGRCLLPMLCRFQYACKEPDVTPDGSRCSRYRVTDTCIGCILVWT